MIGSLGSVLVGSLVGAALASALWMTVREGSNRLISWALDIGSALWTLTVAGLIAALVLRLLRVL